MKIFFLPVFLNIILFLNNACINRNNGDPFDYIGSNIEMLYNFQDFATCINQEDKIIVVISYINNFYGDKDSDFYLLAQIFSDLKRQFGSNKYIEFYRAYMCQGISGALLAPYCPSMQIYFQGNKIKTVDGRHGRDVFFRAIIEALKNNITKSYSFEYSEEIE